LVACHAQCGIGRRENKVEEASNQKKEKRKKRDLVGDVASDELQLGVRWPVAAGEAYGALELLDGLFDLVDLVLYLSFQLLIRGVGRQRLALVDQLRAWEKRKASAGGQLSIRRAREEEKKSVSPDTAYVENSLFDSIASDGILLLLKDALSLLCQLDRHGSHLPFHKDSRRGISPT